MMGHVDPLVKNSLMYDARLF